MPERLSLGLLLYRLQAGRLEVFLGHPGGPYYRTKDEGHWSVPKGGAEPGEEGTAAARREMREEVGIDVPAHLPLIDLGKIQQKGGKWVQAWAVELPEAAPNWDRAEQIEQEWPPRSGRWERFFEMDRACFFPLPEAMRKIKEAQRPLLERLVRHLEGKG